MLHAKFGSIPNSRCEAMSLKNLNSLLKDEHSSLNFTGNTMNSKILDLKNGSIINENSNDF